MTPDDEDLLAPLLRRGPTAGTASACPDDNALAGWAEGRLDGSRREAVERHLAGCDACRSAATDLRDETADAAAGAATGAARARPVLSLETARRRRGPWALAAALLVAVGAGAAIWSAGGKGARGTGDVEERLVAAARDLRERAPAEFADFAPVSAAERRAEEPDATRSAVTILSPARGVLSDRPKVEWVGTLGAQEFSVEVSEAGGDVVWTRRTAEREVDVDVPLKRGTSYVVEVRSVGGIAGGTARTAFRVATQAERASWEAAVAAARARAPDDLADLLLAHVAARRSLLLEAHARVDAYLARAGDEPVGRETRTWIRRRLRWPDESPREGGAPR